MLESITIQTQAKHDFI